MNKIKFAINNYLSSRRYIKEQIKREEEHIKENIEQIKLLMQDDICLGHLKVYGHYSYLDTCYNSIIYHKTNIEKLKKGDVELCKKLINHEIEIEREMELLRNERGCGTFDTD